MQHYTTHSTGTHHRIGLDANQGVTYGALVHGHCNDDRFHHPPENETGGETHTHICRSKINIADLVVVLTNRPNTALYIYKIYQL